MRLNPDQSRKNLQLQSHNLAERMQRIEEDSESGNMNQTYLEAEMREMRARIDMLVNEVNQVSRHVVPPSYASEHGEGSILS
jgi:hypothetical protein